MSIVSFLSELDRVFGCAGCASAAAPGRGTEKGGYRGHLRECPVSVVRRERRISQQWLKSATAVEISRLRGRGNNVPAPRRRLSPVVQKTAVLKTTMLKTAVLKTTVLSSNFREQQFLQAAVFSNNCFGAPCTLPRFSGGSAECAPAFFCSCYLPSRLYCRHRIFTGSASLAGGRL